MLTLMEFNKIFGINNCELPTVKNQEACIYTPKCVKVINGDKPYKREIYEPYKFTYPAKILSDTSVVYDDDGYNSWFTIKFNFVPDENGVFYHPDFFKTKEECQEECDKRNKEEKEKSKKIKKYKLVNPTEIKKGITGRPYKYKYNIGDIVRFVNDDEYMIGFITEISPDDITITHFGNGFSICSDPADLQVEVLQPTTPEIFNLIKSFSCNIAYSISDENYKPLQKFLNSYIINYNKEQSRKSITK